MPILPPRDLLTLRHTSLTTNLQDKMDALKSATNTGSSTTTSTDPSRLSGEEPLSGEQGKGTVNEPFDQGNAEGELCSFFLMG